VSVIDKEIRIRAPRDTVWPYLTEGDLLAAWLMRNNFSAVVGREFQFFAQSSSDWDGVLNCRLLECDPPRKIAFTWDANNIGAETIVTIELLDEGNETVVRLIHANFEQAAGDVDRLVKAHDTGWQDHLAILGRQAEEDADVDPLPGADPDWSQFDLHVAIDAKPEEVIRYWSTPHGMENFFVQMMRITGSDGRERAGEESAQPGDSYTWRWDSGRRLCGQYLASDGDLEVRFTFGESRVALRAVSYRQGTLLRLRQYDIPDTEQARMHVHTNCRAAWVYFLTALKTRLEHGIDCRDKSLETGASFATHFDPASLGVKF